MKSFKTFFSALLLCAIFQFSANAQLKTYTNATNNDTWHDPNNWSPTGVPNDFNDVLIPANSILNIEFLGTGNPFMNNLTVEEGSIVTKFSANQMVIGGLGNFAPDTEFNILEGVVVTKSLIINGELNSIGPLSKGLRGDGPDPSVSITGTMNIQSPSEPFTLREITLHILPSGILTVEEGSIIISAFTGRVLNEGLLQKTAGNGTFTISTSFENDGGTINVDSGSMMLSGGTILTNGQYNVNPNGFLELNNLNTHAVNGTLTGQLDGPFVVNGGGLFVGNGGTNFLDFSGPSRVEWRGGVLSASTASGTVLVNRGKINYNLIGTQQIQLSGGVILRNEGDIFFNGNVNDFSINQNSIFENSELGVITMSDGSATSGGPFTNTGLIQKTTGAGSANIGRLTNNAPGVVNVKVGNVSFVASYEGNGLITGDGSVSPIEFTEIAGTIAPGDNGVGTLDYNNTFEFDSTAECVYQIEINGTTPGSEHDVFTINAPAQLNGSFDIQLGFAPQLNDEFVVITATNVTECTLPAQTVGYFGGNGYTFDVVCGTDNVTLRVIDIFLGIDENIIAAVKAFPNPTSGNFTITIGTTLSEINTTTTNILGQVVAFERFVNTDTLEIDLQGSSPGIYFVTLTTDVGISETIKVVKE